MIELSSVDLQRCLLALPKDIVDLLREHPGELWVAGGFVRSTVAGEQVNDIDLWAASVEIARHAVGTLEQRRAANGAHVRHHKTENASTLLTVGRAPVQAITRWTFKSGAEICESFDFTVCAAVVGFESDATSKLTARSWVHDKFYEHLAARRLVYTAPARVEDCGGSMLRAFKFVARGYFCPASTIAGLTVRLNRCLGINLDETRQRSVLLTNLKLVDPLMLVDGVDLANDHAQEDL